MIYKTINKSVKLQREEPQHFYDAFENFILDQGHPCIMAQSVFKMEQVDFHVYEDFGAPETAEKILRDLKTYLANYNFESNEFLTFIAAFKAEGNFSEVEFEKTLWKQLQYLHEADNVTWDPEVSKDPKNSQFSFSLGGKAFYIVGMHPNSPRKSRQSPFPSIAFNLHWQFEKFREMGVYQNVRDKIRERDIELQGNINPMLEDFGSNSEARQYSGRKVDDEWECPFHQAKK